MYLIDAHSLIFQVFHAIPEMSSRSGLPTNALYGFTRDLLFLREKKPDYLLAAFDLPGPTFRDTLYAEYKAHRAPMPDNLCLQIPEICRLLEAMHLPVLTSPGFEADDVIASVATAAAQRGIEVFICSTDKDCRQLIGDLVRLYNLRKREGMDREALLRDWGVTPEQVVDLQALVGDSVDNVPGVQGIGIKTAAKLLQEFGTLDSLLAACAAEPVAAAAGAPGRRGAAKAEKVRTSLSPRLLENLRAAGDKIQLSRQLVRLSTEVPLEMDWEGWKLQDPDVPRVLQLFQEWGFHRFGEQLRAETRGKEVRQRDLFPAAEESAPEAVPGPEAHGAANGQPAKPPVPWQADYRLVNTAAGFKAFFEQLRQQPRFAVDLETTSLEPRRAEVVGIAVSWTAGEAYYLALRGPAGEPLLDRDKTLAQMRRVLEDPNVGKVNQNIKYDLMVFRQHRIELANVSGDPMVADYLLHAGERSHSMADLANRYLDHQVIPIEDLIGKKGRGAGKKQLSMDEVPTARVAEYSGEDADVAWRLCTILEPKLREQNLWDLYETLEVPLIGVLAELEFNGIRLNVPLLERVGQDMARQLTEIEREITELAGRPFNIASPKQLRQVLFDELKLPTQRRTGITGEASTNQETLERLAALGHRLPQKILEHRQIAKLKGTYVDALPGLVNPATGRIHASFNQTVAATGRLSSSDPNLQNIPIRREQGRQIRQAFIPEEGWTLLTADYSQIELRLLAHFSGDAELRRAFAEDRDIHASVAAQTFGVAEKDVTEDMRRVAKTVNFGVLYGMSAPGLAMRLGIPREEAERFIKSYFSRYPKVAAYQEALLAKCRQTGYVGTILGRRREISGIRPDSTYQQRNQPEREAINMEIQGSAADLIKQAMLNIYRRLHAEKRRSRMLLQIHDELVFEVPPEELQAVARLVVEEMTGALKLEVPLKVDVSAGPNWLDVEDLIEVE
jgi:DNA polymerase-1